MQRKKMLIAVAIVASLLIGSVSAYLLTYYGYIQTTATVGQLVLLDGHDYSTPATHTLSAYGGDEFCFAHWLKNQGHVDVNINQETDGADGIAVEFYKPVKLELTTSDFKYKDDKTLFGAYAAVSWNGGNVVWEVAIDENDIPKHWSTGVQVMIADVSNPKFILGWSPGESTTSPIYKEWTGNSWGTPTTVLPDGMSVNGSYNQVRYKIEIPVKYLGGCGATFYWAINIEATWPGSTGSHFAQYPKNWNRWTATNTASFTIGTPISFPYKLKAGERLDFIICYKFPLPIGPGTYTITTYFKPS
jgi:hypothetical protein